jgi:hypothetical protein
MKDIPERSPLDDRIDLAILYGGCGRTEDCLNDDVDCPRPKLAARLEKDFARVHRTFAAASPAERTEFWNGVNRVF